MRVVFTLLSFTKEKKKGSDLASFIALVDAISTEIKWSPQDARTPGPVWSLGMDRADAWYLIQYFFHTPHLIDQVFFRV